MQFFDNPSAAYRAGQITAEHLDEWLASLDLPDDTKAAKRAATIKPDGSIVQFQVIGLHRLALEQAQRVERERAVAASAEPVPEEMMRYVPEPVYDDPLPDLAGEIKRRLGIIAAVRMFGKPQDRIKDHRTEGVKVRCPNVDHNDANPSAWCNTADNVWYCGKCEEGGDVIDFYAATKGYSVKDFHRNGDFTTVVREMGNELGLHVMKREATGPYELVDDGEVWPSPLPDAPEEVEITPRGLPEDIQYGEPEERSEPEPEVPAVPPSGEAVEPVTLSVDEMMRGIAIETDDDDLDDDEYDPTIPSCPWKPLPINPGSFLGEFMKYHDVYFPWVPEEYFLFCGLQAVGLAMGHFVQSFTLGPLSGALMTTIIGPSGHGKSTAVREMQRMFRRVEGPRFDPELGAGIKQISSPASSEALIKSIYTDIEPAATSTPGVREEVAVTAWLYEEEFATLVERARRRGGGTLKTRLIQLYDFVKTPGAPPETVVDEYSLTSGARILHDSFFAATFTTQTDAISTMMESVDLISGFLNRIAPVMGPQRVRRRAVGALVPPSVPEFDAAYKVLWDRCRRGHMEVPFTEEALKLSDEHPFMAKVDKLAATDTLYARVPHMTQRLAFILAVNNGEREVGVKYMNAAINIASGYLMKCFHHLRSAVIATPEDDAASRIERFVQNWYDKRKRWPTGTEWQNDRASYRSFDGKTRSEALERLFSEGRLVRVTLAHGKGNQKVYIVPRGAWANFEDAHGKKFRYEDVYPEVAT